jgi:hypothetical protein
MPWVVGAVVVSVLSWLPVLVDVVIHRGGNVRLIAGFGGDERTTLGIGSGLKQMIRAMGFPPLLLRTNLSGEDIWAGLGAIALVTGLLALAAMVAIVFWAWRRRPALATLALTTLVVGAFGVINGSQVPDSVEAYRINFYRWTFVVCAFTWLCLGWAAWTLVTARRPAVARVRRVPFAWAVVGGVAVVALLACVASGPRNRRDRQLFGLERRATAAVLPAIEGKKRILLIPAGTSAILGAAPALALDLEQNGHEIYITKDQAPGYGEHRVIGDKDFDAAISYRTSVAGGMVPAPGKVVFRGDLNVRRRKVVEQLAAQAKGKKTVIAPDGPEILDKVGAGQAGQQMMGSAIGTLESNPQRVLGNPVLLKLIKAGYLTSPTFDPKLIDEALALPDPINSWGDELIEIRVLDPDEAREAFPNAR